MSKAAKQYLHRVRKNLSCPKSLSRDLLHQLEDDILLFDEKEEYQKIEAHFGKPEDVAEDILSGLNAAEVSRFAYVRLRILYGVILILVVLLIGFGIPKAVSQIRENRSFLNAYYNEYIEIEEADGPEYSQWEHTVYDGEDIYWGYIPEERLWKQIAKPSENAHEKPVPVGVYVMTDTGSIYWEYDEQKNSWILAEEWFDEHD